MTSDLATWLLEQIAEDARLATAAIMACRHAYDDGTDPWRLSNAGGIYTTEHRIGCMNLESHDVPDFVRTIHWLNSDRANRHQVSRRMTEDMVTRVMPDSVVRALVKIDSGAMWRAPRDTPRPHP